MNLSSDDVNELRELNLYISKIKNHNKLRYNSEKSTFHMVFGLFVIVGGISDLYVSILVKYSPHFPIWFVAIFCGIIAQNIIGSQPVVNKSDITETSLTRAEVTPLEKYLISLVFIITITVAMLFGYKYVMGSVALYFAFLDMLFIFNNRKRNQKHNTKSSLLINLILAFVLFSLPFINEYAIRFQGFIFGIVIGGYSLMIGYKIRNEVVSHLK